MSSNIFINPSDVELSNIFLSGSIVKDSSEESSFYFQNPENFAILPNFAGESFEILRVSNKVESNQYHSEAELKNAQFFEKFFISDALLKKCATSVSMTETHEEDFNASIDLYKSIYDRISHSIELPCCLCFRGVFYYGEADDMKNGSFLAPIFTASFFKEYFICNVFHYYNGMTIIVVNNLGKSPIEQETLRPFLDELKLSIKREFNN